MKIGLDDKEIQSRESAESGELAEMIKKQSSKEETKFSELDRKKKAEYIWDYYRWWIIGGIIAVIVLCVFIRDYRENSKPTFLDVEMLNTYFGYDKSNTLYDDFVREEGIDLTKEHLTISTDTTLSTENFDTTMIAFQQRLIASYAAQEVDVIIGPKKIIEGPANCGAFAEFDKVIPEDLLADLKDRDYEFYYFDPAADEIEDYEGEDITPYCAGIYLDNCPYLNNMGEAGAYPVAESEDDRPVFTIASNSLRIDHAVEFLRFITQ